MLLTGKSVGQDRKVNKERIIAFIQAKGPVIPKQIAKAFDLDTTFAGAYLSGWFFP